jgi:hypothetical protein
VAVGTNKKTVVFTRRQRSAMKAFYGMNQQLLQEDPQDDCMPDSTNPCPSRKSMFVFISIMLARSSRNTLRPFTSRVVSPRRASLAMSIASEGLQPPGTANIRTPSPADPCFSSVSLNFCTALSVRLTIPSSWLKSKTVAILPIYSNYRNCFFSKKDYNHAFKVRSFRKRTIF